MNELKIFIALFVAISSGLMIYAVVKKNDLEILPSFSWLILVIIPFWAQLNTFPVETVSTHAFGVLLIGSCVLVGDLIQLKRIEYTLAIEEKSKLLAALKNYKLYTLVFTLIVILHLTLLKKIPLWEKYYHHVHDPILLATMREETSKLLAVGAFYKYIFNWALIIIGPCALFLMIKNRKYIIAILFFIFSLGYALMSLAQFPAYILLASTAVLILKELNFKRRLTVYSVLIVLSLPVVNSALLFYKENPKSVFNVKASKNDIAELGLSENDFRYHLTYGDHTRFEKNEDGKLNFPYSSYNYLAYRLFLGPTDVSSRWYQYYPSISGHFIGLEGLPFSGKKASKSAAQSVGTWAYRDRFPKKYLDSVSAYASIDADAYARFGLIGIVMAGVLVVLIRLSLKWLLLDSVTSNMLYSIGVVSMALLLPIASLQAILIPNGVFIVLSLMILYKISYVFALKEQKAESI